MYNNLIMKSIGLFNIDWLFVISRMMESTLALNRGVWWVVAKRTSNFAAAKLDIARGDVDKLSLYHDHVTR
jgi:hypothetical protein